MSKHTKTPWTIDNEADRIGTPYIFGVSQQTGEAYCIAEIRIGARMEADARLIAAAPELLEACKEVEAWWLREGKNEFIGAPAGMFMLRAAIQKAEGGE